MKIITLTLNPAFDVHCSCDNFKPYHESIAKITAKDAGGKGVNISRALTANGVENTAVVIVGNENGDEFIKTLEKEGLTLSAVFTDGRIRENITLHQKGNPETRISFDGFACTEDILNRVKDQIGEVDENTIVTFTGSAPKGVSSGSVLAFLQDFKNRGAKIVIDSRSISLDEIVDFKPWLIKPNKDEAEAYANKRIKTNQDAMKIACEYHEKGIENVIITLGGDGAVFACNEGTFYAQVPSVQVRSTIGAGDSTIAGFIVGVTKNLSKAEILSSAVAFGSAACIQEGTKAPDPSDINEIIRKVAVQKI